MKILAFAPHSAIWVHAFPEALVAETLKQSGHDIVYVSCGGQFNSYCIPMSAMGVALDAPRADKDAVCKRCTAQRDIIRNSFDFSGPDVIDLLTDEDRAAVVQVLATLTRHNYIDLELDNIPVGRYALYEFLINHKKDSVVLTDAEWQRFQPELTNSLYSFYACRRLLDQEKPDRVMVYNSFYSVNHVCCELAAQRGIPHYFLHAGNNLANRMQTLFVTRSYTIASWNRNPHWNAYREIPCSRALLSTVTEHVLALFSGLDVFAYSAPLTNQGHDLKARFGVKPGQKVLMATMSSTDERVAAEAIGVQFPDEECQFPTQVEWVSALIEFARGRPDLCLILRVHPRNFPNRREKVKSAQAEVLEKLLQALPDNVRVNWPADNISIYSLAEIVDVVLNGWSNAGKEMSLLGLPVVLYSPHLVTSHPSTLNYVGATRDAYFSQIEQALADGWSFENIRKAYRWCAFEYDRSLIDISESFPKRDQRAPSFSERVVRRIGRTISPYGQQHADLRNRAPELKAREMINKIISNGSDSLLDEIDPGALEKVTLEQETVFLKAEIQRLVAVMYAKETVPTKGGLGEKLRSLA